MSRSRQDTVRHYGTAGGLIIGALAGAAVSLAVILISALILTVTDVSDSTVTLFSLLSVVSGAAVCGFVSAGYNRKRGLLTGVFACVPMVVILFAAKLAVAGISSFGVMSLIYAVAAFVVSGICGIISVNRKLVKGR